MKPPYRKLLLSAILNGCGFTALYYLLPVNRVVAPSLQQVLVTLLLSLFGGGFAAYSAWRAEGYLARRNAKWQEKRKK